MTTNNDSLGIDIGNVIINHRFTNKKDGTLYWERYSTIPAAQGMFDSIKKLNDEKFLGNIFLISKCTPWAQEKNLAWLKDNNFYARTGIKPENVFFCKERHEKGKICSDYNIKYFVDNRLEVLSHMVNSVPYLFLYQPDQSEIDKYKPFLQKVTRVESWSELIEKIK